MKPYGVDRDDRGCCPGHDKYPVSSYGNHRSKSARARDKKQSHGRERMRQRQVIKETTNDPQIST